MTGNAFSVAQISANVSSRSLKVGLEFRSGHSLRIGGATWLARMGWSDAEIESLGNWSSDAVLRYIRIGRVCTLAL